MLVQIWSLRGLTWRPWGGRPGGIFLYFIVLNCTCLITLLLLYILWCRRVAKRMSLVLSSATDQVLCVNPVVRPTGWKVVLIKLGVTECCLPFFGIFGWCWEKICRLHFTRDWPQPTVRLLALTGCVQDIDKLLQRTTVASFMENQVLWARYLREGWTARCARQHSTQQPVCSL